LLAVKNNPASMSRERILTVRHWLDEEEMDGGFGLDSSELEALISE
jgi:hypothetical protein